MIFHHLCSNFIRRNCLNILCKKYSISNLLQQPEVGNHIEVKGWITNIRKQKQYIFLDLNDGSSFQKLQCTLPSNLNIPIKDLSVGSSIKLLGSLTVSPKGDIELFAKELKILTKCNLEEGYPFLQESSILQNI
ncbi:hypothetical protein HHI36_010830 [Cryptolaemus montrouzieri]|uniref:OB domain-containing protein n=1 Tax=Cryptolaemus montrouzieri TaxID=559131 RepID=A0ABD2MJY8_9CUCU